MGRLDRDIPPSGEADIDDDMEIFDMDAVDEGMDDDFMTDIPPDVVHQQIRRRLDNLMEDRNLAKQLDEYNNFDI